MVINKPKGLVVHPSETFSETTLVSGLLHHTGTLSTHNDDPLRPGILHRIDKDTSGLILVAKTNEAHKILKFQTNEYCSGCFDHNKGY